MQTPQVMTIEKRYAQGPSDEQYYSQQSQIQDLALYENGYYYELLNAQDKIIYLTILNCMQQINSKTTLDTIDVNTVDTIFKYVLNDHPEIFYVDGYKCSTNNKTNNSVYEPNYIMSADEIQKYNKKIEEYINYFMKMAEANGIDKYASEYKIVKHVFEYVVATCNYDVNVPYNQTILPIIEKNKGVCQGYAKITQLLLNQLGVDSLLVTGTTENGVLHVWNMVKIDGEYYHVDTTWGDDTFSYLADNFSCDDRPITNYDYLLTTTKNIGHTIEYQDIIPDSNSNRYSYYVKEGLYIEDINDIQLQEIFYQIRHNNITQIKFKNREILDDFADYFIWSEHLYENVGLNEDELIVLINSQKLKIIFTK